MQSLNKLNTHKKRKHLIINSKMIRCMIWNWSGPTKFQKHFQTSRFEHRDVWPGPMSRQLSEMRRADEVDEDSGSGSDCSIDMTRNLGNGRSVPRNSFSRRSTTLCAQTILLSPRPERSDRQSECLGIDKPKDESAAFHHDRISTFSAYNSHRKKDSAAVISKSSYQNGPTSHDVGVLTADIM